MTGPLGRLAAILAALVLLAGPWGPAGGEGNHVRVVLDTSLSMSKTYKGDPPNDPGRLAVLATALLYDLVDPNPAFPLRPDSFEVYPFDQWNDWTDTSAPPTVRKARDAIVAHAQTPAGRARFMDDLKQIRYDAPLTYLYPGLRRALDSLKAQPGSAEDSRVIVLITDGVPEDKTRDAERALLGKLRDEAATAGMRLYVLGFGPAVMANRGLLEDLVQDPAGRPLGRLFVDPDGGRLAATMLDIFSVSFGYAVDAPVKVGNLRPPEIDLEAGITPTKVAVVTLATGPKPPSQALTPVPNSPYGLVTASQPGASYALQWILGPRPGRYVFASDNPAATLAVLRPVAPLLQVRPGRVEPRGGVGPKKEMHQVLKAMAGTRFSLRLLVSSPAGTAGNQPAVHLSFRAHGPSTGQCSYRWDKDKAPPAGGLAQNTPEGVVHELWMDFPGNDLNPDEPYLGHVEIEAKSGDKEVAALRCARAQEIEIFPRLSLTPVPAIRLIGPAPLAPQEANRCVDFTIKTDNPERLAVLGPPPYGLKATLSTRGAPGVLDAELHGSSWRLDGKPIDFEERPTNPPGPWSQGLALTLPELLGSHRLCVNLGRPRIAATTEGLGVGLTLRLIHPAYEDFNVVGPFTARLSVLAAGPLPIDWWALRPLVETMAAIALGLWLWQGRRALGPELRYALWQGETPPDQASELPPRNFWALLIGGAPRRALVAPTSQETLGWVVPRDPGLFALALPPGVGIAAEDNGELPLCELGLYRVQGGRRYRLTRGNDDWRLRFDYAEPKT